MVATTKERNAGGQSARRLSRFCVLKSVLFHSRRRNPPGRSILARAAAAIDPGGCRSRIPADASRAQPLQSSRYSRGPFGLPMLGRAGCSHPMALERIGWWWLYIREMPAAQCHDGIDGELVGRQNGVRARRYLHATRDADAASTVIMATPASIERSVYCPASKVQMLPPILPSA